MYGAEILPVDINTHHFDVVEGQWCQVPSGGFNGRLLVQWPTRPLGGWALEAPGLLGPGRLNFGLQLQFIWCISR